MFHQQQGHDGLLEQGGVDAGSLLQDDDRSSGTFGPLGERNGLVSRAYEKGEDGDGSFYYKKSIALFVRGFTHPGKLLSATG